MPNEAERDPKQQLTKDDMKALKDRPSRKTAKGGWEYEPYDGENT